MRSSGGSVIFEPGVRSNWHIHPEGKVLIITSGVGRTQEWGKPFREIRPGDVIVCPAGVTHWHRAAPNSSMTYISICEEKEPGKVEEWMEMVTDGQYNGKITAAGLPLTRKRWNASAPVWTRSDCTGGRCNCHGRNVHGRRGGTVYNRRTFHTGRNKASP